MTSAAGRDRAGDKELAASIALAELPRMTPAKLRRLVVDNGPVDSWETLASGCAPEWISRSRTGETDLLRLWSTAVRRIDPCDRLAVYRRRGAGAALWSQPSYPRTLRQDTSTSGLVFSLGTTPLAGAEPSVAVVGTRSATPYGRDVAHELGRALSAAGVVVVSGLAEGITACAQQGALSSAAAPPVIVAPGGVDVACPLSLSPLWDRVAGRGAIVSEVPLSGRPDRWRFPWRNRLVAALADVVVVVESHAGGAALAIADAAARRGRPVLAVPGSIRSSASRGSNALIADGCAPCLGPEDVLVALSLAGQSPLAPAATGASGCSGAQDGGRVPSGATNAGVGGAGGHPVAPDERTVLGALEDSPATLAAVTGRTELSIGRAALALDRLVELGLVRDGGGWWCLASPAPNDVPGTYLAGLDARAVGARTP